ncbi:uncharacterized protein LOC143284959 [Babylonia areolata]|uniref:uncharacterized protein LOC143284959 n=1 Tax=Babylonia areolata TaxID=304850 RepID=UPI003FD47FF5
MCDELCSWFHAKCQDIGSGSYDLLGKSDVTWHCVVCANASYSTIAFDLHGVGTTHLCEISDSRHSDTSNCSNINSPFKPLHTSTPSRASKQDKHSRRPLRFLNVNCYSIVGKVAEFSNLVQATRPDIIVGTESWLNQSHSNAEIFPRGFNIYRIDRPPGEWDKENAGGVFILVSENLTSHEMPELSAGYENLWVEIKMKGRCTLLVCCFYHPHTEYTESMNAFVKSAPLASHSYKNTIIVAGGDFNLPGWHWPTKTLKKGCPKPEIHRQFMHAIDDVGWEQMVMEPTEGNNTMDLFLTNHPNLVPRTETLPGIADHDTVYMEMQIHPPKKRQPQRLIPIYTEECEEPLKEAAQKVNDHIMTTFDERSSVEEVWSEIRNWPEPGLLRPRPP